MANFTTRIVLHGAGGTDYDKLYEAMEVEGFTDIITDGDDISYKMPDGEYSISGSFTRSQVLNKARTAAAKSNKKYAVLVTQSSGRTFYKLDRV